MPLTRKFSGTVTVISSVSLLSRTQVILLWAKLSICRSVSLWLCLDSVMCVVPQMMLKPTMTLSISVMKAKASTSLLTDLQMPWTLSLWMFRFVICGWLLSCCLILVCVDGLMSSCVLLMRLFLLRVWPRLLSATQFRMLTHLSVNLIIGSMTACCCFLSIRILIALFGCILRTLLSRLASSSLLLWTGVVDRLWPIGCPRTFLGGRFLIVAWRDWALPCTIIGMKWNGLICLMFGRFVILLSVVCLIGLMKAIVRLPCRVRWNRRLIT